MSVENCLSSYPRTPKSDAEPIVERHSNRFQLTLTACIALNHSDPSMINVVESPAFLRDWAGVVSNNMSTTKPVIPVTNLKERIAALEQKNAAERSTSPSPAIGVAPAAGGSALKDRIAKFEKKGAVPAPRGRFGLGAPPPPEAQVKKSGELYGNRIPQPVRFASAGSQPSSRSGSSIGFNNGSPEMNFSDFNNRRSFSLNSATSDDEANEYGSMISPTYSSPPGSPDSSLPPEGSPTLSTTSEGTSGFRQPIRRAAPFAQVLETARKASENTEVLTNINDPLSPTPFVNSKRIVKQAELENGEIEVGEDEEDVLLEKKKRKAEKRMKVETPMPAQKERKRRREEEDSNAVTVEAVTARLKSTSSRSALQPIDNNNTIHDQYEEHGKLGVPPRDSLSPSPVFSTHSEADNQQDGGGRGRRSRSSVNYAEPKLNTKMRRPENVPELRKKRSSSAAASGPSKLRDADSEAGTSSKPVSTASSRARSSSPPPQEDLNGVTTMRRRKSKPQMYHVDDDDEEEASDGDQDDEWAPSGSSKKLWANVNVEGRKRLPGRRTGGAEEGRRHSMAV
ncbi:hypothetical protein NMY22_g15917 [Coprinellus aureogranulatus]|nr:hypothetical protein NMY22_g15917 [Coprinellus aureogranulatus]